MWGGATGQVPGFILGEMGAAKGRIIGALLEALDLRLGGLRVSTRTLKLAIVRLGFELLVGGWGNVLLQR